MKQTPHTHTALHTRTRARAGEVGDPSKTHKGAQVVEVFSYQLPKTLAEVKKPLRVSNRVRRKFVIGTEAVDKGALREVVRAKDVSFQSPGTFSTATKADVGAAAAAAGGAAKGKSLRARGAKAAASAPQTYVLKTHMNFKSEEDDTSKVRADLQVQGVSAFLAQQFCKTHQKKLKKKVSHFSLMPLEPT